VPLAGKRGSLDESLALVAADVGIQLADSLMSTVHCELLLVL
jgi:hypothetical protein